jgi:two-component system sensor histidine kinase DesK
MRLRLLPEDSPVGWLPYSWLIYLSLYIVYPLLAHVSAGWWVIHAVGLVVFLGLYFRGFWLDGPRVLPIMWGIAAIGIVLIPWNPGASVFFVYAAGFAGDVGRPGVALRWLLAIVAVLAAETILVGLRMEAWIPGVVISLMVGGGNIYFAEKRRADSRLRLAQDEVAHLAKVAERERIARDLHDLLGHTLSLIVLKSELAAKLAERDPARAAVEIRDVERISRDALGEVRRAVQGYREMALAESLAGGRRALAAAGVAFDAEVATQALDPRLEGVVVSVMREAVTNIIRHAKATHCRLQLVEDAGTLRLEIRDDGVGGHAMAGTGLAGMRARVEELGGTFDHDGASGTTLRVALPLHGATAARLLCGTTIAPATARSS